MVEKKIPRRNQPSSLIHRQVAIKFGRIHEFDMPSYRKAVKKLDIHSHAHVRRIVIVMFMMHIW